MTLGPLMVDVAGEALTPADRHLLREPAVGAVILFSRNFRNKPQAIELIKEIKSIRSPELLIAVDQEGGRVQRFKQDFTRIPPMRSLGRLYEERPESARELAREVGWLLGAELAEIGVDFSFTPVVDLDHGVSDVIGDRAFHRDPDVVAQLATALMRGLGDAGQVAVAKHFPGHGAVAADSHLELPVDQRALAELDADLAPFRRLAREQVVGVMTAHVVYSACDPLPPTISPWWLKEMLRKEIGFDGVIFSDDLDMAAMRQFGSIPECAIASLEAGCDLALVCNNRPAAEASVDRLATYSSPPSMLRRARLRSGAVAGSARDNDRWQRAITSIAALDAPPDFELEA